MHRAVVKFSLQFLNTTLHSSSQRKRPIKSNRELSLIRGLLCASTKNQILSCKRGNRNDQKGLPKVFTPLNFPHGLCYKPQSSVYFMGIRNDRLIQPVDGLFYFILQIKPGDRARKSTKQIRGPCRHCGKVQRVEMLVGKLVKRLTSRHELHKSNLYKREKRRQCSSFVQDKP